MKFVFINKMLTIEQEETINIFLPSFFCRCLLKSLVVVVSKMVALSHQSETFRLRTQVSQREDLLIEFLVELQFEIAQDGFLTFLVLRN